MLSEIKPNDQLLLRALLASGDAGVSATKFPLAAQKRMQEQGFVCLAPECAALRVDPSELDAEYRRRLILTDTGVKLAALLHREIDHAEAHDRAQQAKGPSFGAHTPMEKWHASPEYRAWKRSGHERLPGESVAASNAAPCNHRRWAWLSHGRFCPCGTAVREAMGDPDVADTASDGMTSDPIKLMGARAAVEFLEARADSVELTPAST